MTTNNHSASHERPPASRKRRNVLGENLLTIVTIIGVVGKLKGTYSFVPTLIKHSFTSINKVDRYLDLS